MEAQNNNSEHQKKNYLAESNASQQYDNIINKVLDFETQMQIIIQKQDLRRGIFALKTTCGSCNHWMKSSCPREKHHKVNCNEWKCDVFEMESFTLKLVEKKQIELDSL